MIPRGPDNEREKKKKTRKRKASAVNDPTPFYSRFVTRRSSWKTQKNEVKQRQKKNKKKEITVKLKLPVNERMAEMLLTMRKK